MVFDVAIYVISVLFLLFGLRAILRTGKSIQHIRSARRTLSEKTFDGSIAHASLAILVPVLREQSVVIATLKWLLDATTSNSFKSLRIVVITSERENFERERDLGEISAIHAALRTHSARKVSQKYPGLGPPSLVVPLLAEPASTPTELLQRLAAIPLTSTVVSDFVSTRPAESRIILIRCPYRTTSMARQLNYAMRYLFEAFDHGLDDRTTYVAMYNADSKPDPRTFATSHIQNDASNWIWQQPSQYVLPPTQLSWLRRIVLSAAAAWQNRWSLSVEIPRWAQAERNRNNPQALLSPGFRYTVGHGLVGQLHNLIRFNYLPESVPNEDAALGFLLQLTGDAPSLLPYFDVSEVPRSVTDLFAQQAGWYVGPRDAAAYRALADRRQVQPGRGRSAISVMLAAYTDALNWIAGPLTAVASAALVPILAPSLAVLFFSTFSFYLLAPTVTASLLLTSAGASPNSARPRLRHALVGMPLFYLLHGAAALTSEVQRLTMRKRNTLLKYKTER